MFGRFSLRSLADEGDVYFRYATTHYEFDPKYTYYSGFWSSEYPFVLAAVTAAKVFFSDGSFDIRFLGVVHSTFFLLAFALALPLFHRFRINSRRILLGLAILIFADMMYVEYFNSFYMDTAAFLFLSFAVVFFLHACCLPASRFAPQLFLICCCLFLLAKAQHAPLCVGLALFCLPRSVLLWPSRPTFSRVFAIGCLVLCAAFAFLSPPRGYTTPPLHSVIFSGLLPSAGNPSQELRELGLDDSYLRYKGTSAYGAESPVSNPEWSAKFVHRTSYRKLALFYLRHPWRAAHILGIALDDASYQRPRQLGNFDKAAGHPPYAKSNFFALWSGFKTRLFEHHGWIYFAYFAALTAILARWHLNHALVLGLMACLALAIAGLADFLDTTRHLFLFNFLVDLTGICAVAASLYDAKAAPTEILQPVQTRKAVSIPVSKTARKKPNAARHSCRRKK